MACKLSTSALIFVLSPKFDSGAGCGEAAQQRVEISRLCAYSTALSGGKHVCEGLLLCSGVMTWLIRHGWLAWKTSKTFAEMEGYLNGSTRVGLHATGSTPSASLFSRSSGLGSAFLG